ncbi:unnamed protein product [Paramecium pentaurelia]|uniref:Uncharacterized protein n=1 Tax=Paramecium pentaurelia TaxID=43138 RepID=A0A8S1X3N5_9CILI|nr:unnamed protein product [Paramecium pentaurelia]
MVSYNNVSRGFRLCTRNLPLKIELTFDYPIKNPNIFFLTQNGRFEVKTTIFLYITKFNPEN